MTFGPGFEDLGSGDFDPHQELFAITRALRAHAEYLKTSGAFGVPRSDTTPEHTRAGALATGASSHPSSSTEPPPSLAPQNPVAFNAPQRSPERVTPARAPNIASGAQQSNTASPAAVAPASHRIAASSLSLEERHARLQVLATRVVGCTLCRLHERRTQTVFARGTGSSGLCFIGEGPGADEDVQGLPFVGAAGQLLDRMIAAMGLTRDEVYVCNIVKCRPPDNRKPLSDEMSTCVAYLREQLEILSPEVIVALGATAVEGLLGISGGITRLRGTWKLYQGRIAVMPTFHPAYLLRVPNAKHAVWQDMQAVLHHLGRPVPARGKK